MAFYPDELSPIDRIPNLGKSAELPDISLLKNRRQWKSLVLGKKDMGINNFATITEEKEEDISSDGSQGGNSNKETGGCLSISNMVLTNKKITFPKPRKYITSRVSDRKDDLTLRSLDSPVLSIPPLVPPTKESLTAEKKKISGDELFVASSRPRPNTPELRQLLKAKKSKELLIPRLEIVDNFSFNETPIDAQWNAALSDTAYLTGWPKSINEKVVTSKPHTTPVGKVKSDEKKKSTVNSKSINVSEIVVQEAKQSKKKVISVAKKDGQPVRPTEREAPSTSKSRKAVSNKGKQKLEKGKTLNMKDVVNVYKNLAYGSKDEIKTFVENLSFVKDETKTENDKNLLSVKNLKALENRIKNFTNKGAKYQETGTSQEKSTKPVKVKKNRKAHIERLARHKVVKVPAVLNYNYLRNSMGATAGGKDKASGQKNKKHSGEDKEPWKYVGMQSALDKTYFVYPAYPPSVNLKKALKKTKGGTKADENKTGKSVCHKEKKGKGGELPAKFPNASEFVTKVKSPEIVIRQNLITKGNPNERIRSGTTRSVNPLNISGSSSSKSMNRSSATTVCNVQFRSANDRQTHFSVEEPELTDPSLLVYLHGTKAINVKSPYSDKQFSRVKVFRKDGKKVPLIRGVSRKALTKNHRNVSIRNINLPEMLHRVRSLDMLDFDEDIQNITDFLRSQNSPNRERTQEQPELKPREKVWCPKDLSNDEEHDSRRQRRILQTHQHHHHHHHQHGTVEENLSPDSIINEISKHIQHLQYLPDTEENRKMIAQFFDELDHRIEASKNGGRLNLQKFQLPTNSYRPIPILGY